jgi:hypothetical protein
MIARRTALGMVLVSLVVAVQQAGAAPKPTCTADASFANSAVHAAANACDGKDGTAWTSGPAPATAKTPHWVQVSLGAVRSIKSVSVKGGPQGTVLTDVRVIAGTGTALVEVATVKGNTQRSFVIALPRAVRADTVKIIVTKDTDVESAPTPLPYLYGVEISEVRIA